MNEYETKGKDTYTQEEAFQSSLNYFNGDELAARVWVNKYAFLKRIPMICIVG